MSIKNQIKDRVESKTSGLKDDIKDRVKNKTNKKKGTTKS